jgi:hypothetical protein
MFEITSIEIKLEQVGAHQDVLAPVAELSIRYDDGYVTVVDWSWEPELIHPDDPRRATDAYDAVREGFVSSLIEQIEEDLESAGDEFSTAGMTVRIAWRPE